METSLPEGEVLSIESRKRNALFALLGIAVVSSIATWVFAGAGIGYTLALLASAGGQLAAVIFWCIADAEERNYDLTIGQRIFIVIFAVIGLPYYLIKSRGVANGLRATLWALFFWILMYFASVITLAVLTLVEDRLGVLQKPVVP